MELTAFFPFFLMLLIWSACNEKHWLAATGFACFLQGASPFIMTAGGRLSGVAPGYLLVCVGIYHLMCQPARQPEYKGAQRQRKPQSWSPPHIWLWLFTIVGVVGALLLPRVFQGVAHAMDTRSSINSATMYAVQPSGTNIIQAFYLVLNLALFSLASRFVKRDSEAIDHGLRGVALGLAFACSLGVYQLIAFYTGLPWPTDVINSNTGVGQFPEQMAGSIKRITSTFWEPSLLGYHFVGCIGLFLIGRRHAPLGVAALCVMLLSTSSLGYFGFMALLSVWLVIDRRSPMGAKVKVLGATVAVGALFILADYVVLDGEVLRNMVLNKGDSSSGVGRSTADRMALQTFLESGGFGVGVGSARASSFVATLLATTGLAGVIAFVGFAASLVLACWRSPDPQATQLCYGLIGFLIVWAIAIPDSVQALFWFVAGTAAGHVARLGQTERAPAEAIACSAK
jgi:hypothetical protein